MKNKKEKERRTSRQNPAPAVVEGEIDVLKVLVKSTLAKNQTDKVNLTEASFGAVRVDFSRHELYKNGKQLRTNAREFQLLKYFLRHEGKVVSRQELLTDVWGFKEIPDTRSVDNYILSLRKKIEEDPSKPRHLLTFRGAGYKFVG